MKKAPHPAPREKAGNPAHSQPEPKPSHPQPTPETQAQPPTQRNPGGQQTPFDGTVFSCPPRPRFILCGGIIGVIVEVWRHLLRRGPSVGSGKEPGGPQKARDTQKGTTRGHN